MEVIANTSPKGIGTDDNGDLVDKVQFDFWGGCISSDFVHLDIDYKPRAVYSLYDDVAIVTQQKEIVNNNFLFIVYFRGRKPL